jgi:hypothetical protein
MMEEEPVVHNADMPRTGASFDMAGTERTAAENAEALRRTRAAEGWQIARDRVILYVTALDLPPFKGLELALESLKRSGPTDVTEAMRTLRELLAEHGLDRGIRTPEGAHLSSQPPLNRGIMVAKELDRLPWLSGLKSFLTRWKRDLLGQTDRERHAAFAAGGVPALERTKEENDHGNL